jgi:hypothetical protein
MVLPRHGRQDEILRSFASLRMTAWTIPDDGADNNANYF